MIKMSNILFTKHEACYCFHGWVGRYLNSKLLTSLSSVSGSTPCLALYMLWAANASSSKSPVDDESSASSAPEGSSDPPKFPKSESSPSPTFRSSVNVSVTTRPLRMIRIKTFGLNLFWGTLMAFSVIMFGEIWPLWQNLKHLRQIF